MKDTNTKRIALDSKHPHKMDSERKQKLLSKSNEQIREEASNDPDNPILSKEELDRLKPAVNVKALRLKLGMSQSDFAKTYNLTLATVRDWEQGRSIPDRSSRTLLELIAKAPILIAQKLKEELPVFS